MFRSLVAVVAIVLLAGLALVSALAHADGTPDLSATVSSSDALFGDPVHVTVSALNPVGSYGYNLSFRVVLPAGVTYVAGSARVRVAGAHVEGAGGVTG